MNLPGSARSHVWIGLVVALVGIAVAGYAYTGDRAYDILYVLVAFLGFALLVLGSLLTGWGQANRPRMGGKAARRKEEAKGSEGLTARLKAWVASGSRQDESTPPASEDEDEHVVATVRCPDCGEVFTASGVVPFETTCPSCGKVDQVRAPEPLEVTGGGGEPTGSPRSQPQPADPCPEDQDGDQAAELSLGQRVKRGLSRAEPVTATLACQACGEVFTATGKAPFETACPACGHAGIVHGPEA